jgi:nucleoside-diphosphate-sugar epimerase
VTHLPEVAGDVRSTWADLTRSKEVLNFEPQMSLEEGIESQVEWFLKEGPVSSAARR